MGPKCRMVIFTEDPKDSVKIEEWEQEGLPFTVPQVTEYDGFAYELVEVEFIYQAVEENDA